MPVFFREATKTDELDKTSLVREVVFLRIMFVMLWHYSRPANEKHFKRDVLNFYKDALDAVNNSKGNFSLIQMSQKTYINIVKQLEKGRIK
jgi:hypothetical protein